jgi:thiol-disulfide isomerase/thioredoxin
MKNAALALLAVLALGAAPQDEPKYPTLPIGSPPVDFSLPGVDGKTYALKDFASAKVLLIIFDTVHCPTSQAFQERIKQVVTDYKDKGVQVVAISPSHPGGVRLDELGYTDLDDSFASMKIRAKDKQHNYPFLYDGEPNQVSQAYGPKATPHCFLFDADRKLRYNGRVDDNENPEKVKSHDLRNALDAVLAGKEPPVTVTKAMGCSTKWPFKQADVQKYNDKILKEPVTVDAADAAAIKDLRRNESGKVRLIHVWSTSDASQLKALCTMNHMYRRRNFQLATLLVASAEKKDEAVALLKKDFPPATNRNLVVAEKDAVREALDAGWDGTLPFTLLVSATNEVLYRKSGAVDDLELKRTIVRNLKADR